MLDLLAHPELVEQAWDYFRTVQAKDRKYEPLVGPTDRPETSLNAQTMGQHRPAMKKYCSDPARYKSDLDQLGITYPTVRQEGGRAKQ